MILSATLAIAVGGPSAAVWAFETASVLKQQHLLWDPDHALPNAGEIPLLANVRFEVIQSLRPDLDGFSWLHGVALAWHRDRLYASFARNQGSENSAGEMAHGRVSNDGGNSWGPLFTIEAGSGNMGVSHGVLLSHRGELWAFQGAFQNRREQIHTRAYVLNEPTGTWDPRGVVIADGFWPLQEPIRMADGNWIMAGTKLIGDQRPYRNPPAVAVSHGEDFLKWDLVVLEPDESVTGDIWGESTVIVDGARITNIARYGGDAVALVSQSSDFGRTWAKVQRSNLPMVTSKPYAGILSTGQRYLIATTTADSGRRRSPLTIAVTRPGETQFSRVFRIRDAVHEGTGESHPSARLSYPYAVEHRGHLYVGFSNSGSRGGNRNSAELAVIPLESLAVP